MQKNFKLKHDPMILRINILRTLILAIVFYVWVNQSLEPVGMLLILSALIYMIIRYIAPNSTTVFFWGNIFIAVLIIFVPALTIAYVIPVLESFVAKKYYTLVPGLLLGLFTWDLSFEVIIILMTAALVGEIIRTAVKEREFHKQSSDNERSLRYQVERFNSEILSNQEEALHMTELTERNRIAQQLHDEVGHELTGAVLGLQVFDAMLKKHHFDDKEIAVFEKVKERVDNSAYVLRQTVHNMNPYVPIGIDDLKNIADDFNTIPMEFNVYGNPDRVPAHYWVTLKLALKEGMTNAIRHSNANMIKVQIDINPNIVRFFLENDGVGYDMESDSDYKGMGIRNLRRKTKAQGGVLTASKIKDENKYQMIIVLPISGGPYYDKED